LTCRGCGSAGWAEAVEPRLLLAGISGTLFDDSNGDGRRAASEAGLPGPMLYVDANGNSVADVTADTFASSLTAQPIPDGGTLQTTALAAGLAGAPRRIEVSLSLGHQREGDLAAALVSPAGTRVPLFSHVAAAPGSLSFVTIADDGSTPVGVDSPDSVHTPQSPLSVLAGEDLNGPWTLELTDDVPGVAGGMNSWQLLLQYGEPVARPDAAGHYAFAGLPAGTHTVALVQNEFLSQTAPPLEQPQTVTVGENDSVTLADFGARQFSPGWVAGYVYDDANANARFDDVESGLQGQTVYFDENNNGSLDPTVTTRRLSGDAPRALADARFDEDPESVITSELGLGETSWPATVYAMTVNVDIDHPRPSELDVTLISPIGTRYELFHEPPGVTSLRNATFPTSAYQGDEPKSGYWLLEVHDQRPGNTGALLGWSMTLTTQVGEPSAVTDAAGAYQLGNFGGETTLRQVVPEGFAQTSPAGGEGYRVQLAEEGLPALARQFGDAPRGGAAPVGPEIHLSGQQIDGRQLAPAVAVAGDGSFVAAWHSERPGSVKSDVFARLYAPGGTPLGGPFQVNAKDVKWADSARVAMDARGNFVVTWTAELTDFTSDVYARRFAADGSALGNEFRVNTTTAQRQESAAVAMEPDGDFVIAWTGWYQAGGSFTDIYARRYDAAGAPRGGEFRVNESATYWQTQPDVAADDAGNFVVAWTGSVPTGQPVGEIEARRFGADGSPRGKTFLVGTPGDVNVGAPSVAMDADGDFAIGYGASNEANGGAAFVRRYRADGAPPGPATAVYRSVAFSNAPSPQLAMDSIGNLVVGWTASSDVHDVNRRLFAQVYGPGGDAEGERFSIDSYDDNQAISDLALSDRGRLVTVWNSLGHDGGAPGVNGDWGVYGQRFDLIVKPPAATVAGRYVFYNGSRFDGGDAGAGASDDLAIVGDKSALPAGAAPAFWNVTSYDKGLNGIMIDVAGLPDGAALKPDDFTFRTSAGAGGGPTTWADGPAPASIDVRRGAGVGGSDRVTLTWRAYNRLDASPLPQAVANGWLTVTVKANDHTGLATPDVFSFGNLIGETDGAAGGTGGWRVNALDLGAVKKALNSTVGPSAATDVNRDGRVNALDLGIVKRNLNRGLPIPVAMPALLFSDYEPSLPPDRVADEIL
jgi:subtilisin-like proprotein convertase family protein